MLQKEWTFFYLVAIDDDMNSFEHGFLSRRNISLNCINRCFPNKVCVLRYIPNGYVLFQNVEKVCESAWFNNPLMEMHRTHAYNSLHSPHAPAMSLVRPILAD